MNRKSLLTVLVALAALVTPGAVASPSPAPGDTTTPMERVSAYTTPSIVYLATEWTGRVYDRFNKQYLNFGSPFYLAFQCTGSVVNSDGYIATAGHCVDPDEVRPLLIRDAAQWALDNGYYVNTTLTLDDVIGFNDYVVVHPDNEKRRPVLAVTAAWSVSAGGVETGKALPARVVKWRTFGQGDAALLKVEADNLNAIPLSTEDLEIGTEIVSIGYPGSVDLVTDPDFTPSFKDGSISSRKTVSNGLLTVYEISAAVASGMSGGPTVNLDSEVVGFNSFGINSAIETQQFNFVRPARGIIELLGDAGTSNVLSQDSQDYRAGLDAYFAGDKTEAVEKLQSVVDNQPTHELAKTYLEKAKDLPDPVVEEDSSSTGLIIGVIAGVGALGVVFLGGLLLLLRRRSRSAPTATYAVSQRPAGGPPPVVATPAAPAPVSGGGAATVVRGEVTAAPHEDGPGADDGEVFCPECGARHDPHQKFCTHCGATL